MHLDPFYRYMGRIGQCMQVIEESIPDSLDNLFFVNTALVPPAEEGILIREHMYDKEISI